MEKWIVGYNRLSDADNKNDESSSIKSQKMIIESFAKFNNMKIEKHYIDDGFSGGNFDRPGFQEMIKDIEEGKIKCVITKDLSRLGREMYKTGNYIEDYFISKGVRYIAINDSYDSDVGDSMLGIRLSVNDLYLRDVSKKVRTSLRAKQNKGDYIGSFPLYGYKKDPYNKHKLIVDDDVRDIVELIYEMCDEGHSPIKIAEHLTKRKVPIPIVYKKEPRASNVTENDGYGIWKRQTVKSILTNEMYIGNMVQNTYNKVSYNSKKLRRTKDEEKIIVKGTHEAIVSEEQFYRVQELLKSKEKRYDVQFDYLLGGLLYCKECGRTIRISKQANKYSVTHYTQCNLYTRKGKFGVCSSHRLSYDDLEEDIIEYLQKLCEKVCEFYDFNELEDNSLEIVSRNLGDLKRKEQIINDKIKNYNLTIDSMYIDKLNGLVDEEMYKRIYTATNKEIGLLKEKLDTIAKKVKMYEEQSNSYFCCSFSRCKSAVLDYMAFRKPNKEQVKRLIEKIEIDKDKKVYVHLKFKEMELESLGV